MTGNRNLFRITRFVLLKVPGLFKLFSKIHRPQKHLLIIKTDAIGDYILFRNFIQTVKESEKFKGYQVDLLGNTVCKAIALQYDAEFVNRFYFINPDELYYAPFKVLRIGWQLYRSHYEVVLQPSFTRTFIESGLAGLTTAKEIIGFETNTERIQAKYKTKTDRFYTERLLLPPNIYFEFDRTRFFFEKVLSETIKLKAPFIENTGINRKGIVIFPGAGVSRRGWEAAKFLDLIKLIRQNSSQPVYLCGGPAEIPIANYLTEQLPPGSVNNLTGKTSLPQLITLIGNAVLLIANETSAIHIAAATKTKSVCILGGGHFGRFAPYPETKENGPICVFESMECYNCNWECIFRPLENEQFPCISAVSISAVWNMVLPLLPEDH